MAVRAERLDVGPQFTRWSNDLHRPEVELRVDGHAVTAALAERHEDGTVVFAATDPGALDDVAPGSRLGILFRADRSRSARGSVPPLFTADYTVDRSAGTVEAYFPPEEGGDGRYALPEPVVARVESTALFRRPQRVGIVRLSPYGGELVADDAGNCLVPGMAVQITLWLPWAGELRLRAQLTAYRGEVGGGWFAFRIVDRRSVRNAAVALVGAVDEFTFDDLRVAGVRPSRVGRQLTLRTVSDDAMFRRALQVRLVGNRHYGRLGGVRDATELVDDLDPASVNVVCLLGDKPLGVGRIVVNGGDRTLSEIEAETDGLPDWVWEGGFVEVSRVAIHPDYRGGGVLVALFREIARLAFHLECRYLMLDSIEKLVPIYERIGAKRLPIVKQHPYSRETVHVMVIDIAEHLNRVDRRAVHWQYVFGPVLGHHDRTSVPTVERYVTGAGAMAYRMKRALSRAQ